MYQTLYYCIYDFSVAVAMPIETALFYVSSTNGRMHPPNINRRFHSDCIIDKFRDGRTWSASKTSGILAQLDRQRHQQLFSNFRFVLLPVILGRYIRSRFICSLLRHIKYLANRLHRYLSLLRFTSWNVQFCIGWPFPLPLLELLWLICCWPARSGTTTTREATL